MLVELQVKKDPHRENDRIHWPTSQPFIVNPRAILIHRIRYGTSFRRIDGTWSHDTVETWCGNGFNSMGAVGSDIIVADPPKSKLLCARCELIAVQAGEKSADELTGRHVHIGRVRAFRTCCHEIKNKH